MTGEMRDKTREELLDEISRLRSELTRAALNMAEVRHALDFSMGGEPLALLDELDEERGRHEAVRRERDELRAEVTKLTEEVAISHATAESMRGEADRLRAKLEAAQKATDAAWAPFLEELTWLRAVEAAAKAWSVHYMHTGSATNVPHMLNSITAGRKP